MAQAPMNKVGDRPFPPGRVAAFLKETRDHQHELRNHGVLLGKEERTKLLRPPDGMEPIARLVIDLAAEYGLEIPAFPKAGLVADLDLLVAFAPIERELALAHQIAADSTAQAKSEAAQAVWAYLGVLSSLSDKIPDLAVRLGPALDWARTNRRATEAAPAEASTDATADSSGEPVTS